MTRARFQIHAVVSIVALIFVAVNSLEPQLLGSWSKGVVNGFAFGIVVGTVLMFTMVAFKQIEIIYEEDDSE